MAIFNPEVRTVNGTNVGTYSPPTVDYSGVLGSIGASIGNAIEDLAGKGARGSGSGESATERKEAALQEFTRGLLKSESIENKTQKAVFQKNLYLNSITEYPLYDEDFKRLRATFNGETYAGTGTDTVELVQGNIKTWATSDPEGQRTAGLAYIKAGGDPIKMDSLIAEGYYKDLAHKATMRRLDEETKLSDLEEKQRKVELERKIRPELAKKYNEMFKEDVSPEAVQAARQKAIADGVDPDSYVLDTLKAAKENAIAAFNLEANTMGFDPAPLVESITAPWTSAVNTLTENKDALSRALSTKSEEERALIASKVFGDDPVGTAIFLGKITSPEVIIEYFTNTENKALFQEAVNYKVGIAGNGSAPEVAGVIDPDMSPTDSVTVIQDRWSNFADREEIGKVVLAPVETKDSLAKLGRDALSGFQYNPNLPEAASGAYKKIGSMFITTLPEIDKDRSSTKSSVVSKLLSDSTFTTFEEIGKGNSTWKADLYNKAAQYSVNTIRHVEQMFAAQIKNMGTIPGYPPFVLASDKNGIVSLQVNPEAVNVDPNLKKAMGMYRYSGGGRGPVNVQEVPASVVDPQKILENYTSIVTVFGTPFGGNSSEIKDYVKTLNIISRQANRIPPEIRNRGADPMQIIRSITKTLE